MTIYSRAGQATYYNMAFAHCMLYTFGYKHTLRICKRPTYCFFPLQRWLHESASMLRYTYIASLVSHCYHATTYASKKRLGITKATTVAS
jgi:hypothetical protein